MAVEKYKVAQLYSVAEVSKENTGGGEGVEIVVNEPFEGDIENPLSAIGKTNTKGQYTHKIYHMDSKMPPLIRRLTPTGALEFHEKAWNAYPYTRSEITNPDFMKDAFGIKIETMHYPDRGNVENIHGLEGELLQNRTVTVIDIANDRIIPEDYSKETDPKLYKSEKTGRGPLDTEDWMKTVDPVMCAYKLVTIKCEWFGLQNRLEAMIKREEHRLFTTFYRRVFCWTDKWHGMTMDDIRAIEDKTKQELNELRNGGERRGMAVKD